MVKLIQLSFFLLFSVSLSSQIVITEISYNPPESNTDSLEYIEIHNAGPDAIDISGYHFTDGIVDTVSAGTVIDPSGYYVFSVNSQAMQTVYGIETDQWTEGALRNGGELIVLSDASGAMVDMVEYGDDNPWPNSSMGTDGEGASIELCDISSDNNDGSNWRVSSNDLGIALNGKNIFGSPGAENQTECNFVADATIRSFDTNVYDPSDITINVGETVQWINVSGFHNVNGDQSVFPNNPESFGNGSASTDNWTFEYTFTVPGLYDYQCDPHAGLGMVGTVTVIDPNAGNDDFPAYSIGDVTSVDAEGVADSSGVACTLTGTVHSPNFRLSQNGLIFTIIDASNNGIGVFSNSDNLGYTVADGDVVEIEGTISQFRGLTQIDAATVTVTGNNSLFDPTIVTGLDESTESQLVLIENVDYVDPAQWVPDGSGFNVMVSDGNNTYDVRIDNDTETFLLSSPIVCTSGSLSIIGIGGQFVNPNEPPYNSGYQLLPRYNSDFLCTSSITELDEGDLQIFPNPVDNLLNMKSNLEIARYLILDMNGKLVSSGAYNSSINVSELNTGQYTILLEVEKTWNSKRFIKK